MPVRRVSGGFRWGSRGKLYRGAGAKAKAAKQGRAIHARKAASSRVVGGNARGRRS
jgi:hypothetical protein